MVRVFDSEHITSIGVQRFTKDPIEWLLQFIGVEEDGDGAGVDQINLHVGSETACFDLESVGCAEGLIEIVVQR